ncbi:hypothetical protein WG66_003103 [Moniliophthora roreri]|nr:hypothetical protein WG66_003103 [Moniliophthora roreri]
MAGILFDRLPKEGRAGAGASPELWELEIYYSCRTRNTMEDTQGISKTPSTQSLSSLDTHLQLSARYLSLPFTTSPTSRVQRSILIDGKSYNLEIARFRENMAKLIC